MRMVFRWQLLSLGVDFLGMEGTTAFAFDVESSPVDDRDLLSACFSLFDFFASFLRFFRSFRSSSVSSRRLLLAMIRYLFSWRDVEEGKNRG